MDAARLRLRRKANKAVEFRKNYSSTAGVVNTSDDGQPPGYTASSSPPGGGDRRAGPLARQARRDGMSQFSGGESPSRPACARSSREGRLIDLRQPVRRPLILVKSSLSCPTLFPKDSASLLLS